LKITYLYQYFGTPSGSWSTRVYELTKRWVEAGHDVTVITAPYDKSDIKANGLISRQTIEGVKLVVIDSGDSNRIAKWKRVFKALQFSILASIISSRTKSDIIIASSGPITIGIPGLIGKWLNRKPLVFEVRDLWPDGGIEMGLIKGKAVIKMSRWFESVCYRNSQLIIACSIGMEQSINDRFPKSKSIVIPNASDLNLFQSHTDYDFVYPSWFNNATKLFLYTGSLGLMDSCMEIIEGFSWLKDKENIHIVFLGDGSERGIMEKRVKELSLEKNIHFKGLVAKNEVVGWYKKALASFVVFKNFPVLSTSSPNKMFDSFAAGVPIIQNTKGWISDLVTERECGINVAPNNTKEMADAILQMVANKELQNKFSNNALKLAQTEFNRDLLAFKYLKNLTDIARKQL